MLKIARSQYTRWIPSFWTTWRGRLVFFATPGGFPQGCQGSWGDFPVRPVSMRIFWSGTVNERIYQGKYGGMVAGGLTCVGGICGSSPCTCRAPWLSACVEGCLDDMFLHTIFNTVPRAPPGLTHHLPEPEPPPWTFLSVRGTAAATHCPSGPRAC